MSDELTAEMLDAMERTYAKYRASLSDVNAIPAEVHRRALEKMVWDALPALIAAARRDLLHREQERQRQAHTSHAGNSHVIGTFERASDDATTGGAGDEH